MKDHRFAASKTNILGDSPRIKVESGTCNVCSAPCSSCLHRTISRAEYGSSGKARGIAEVDSCSFITAEERPSFKGIEYDDQQYESSETSNQPSVTSSHASYSQNAKSKLTLKPPIVSDSSEVVDMPSVVEFRCTSDLKQEEPQHGEECHGGNITCISGISVSRDPSTDMSKKAQPSNFASTGEPQRTKVSQDNVACGSEAKCNSRGNLDVCSEQSLRNKRSDASDQYTVSDKSGAKELLRAKSTKLSSRSGSSQQHSGVDLQRNLVCKSRGYSIGSGCLVDNVECSSKGQLAFDTVDGDIPANNEESNASEIRDESCPSDSKNEISCSKNDPEVVTNGIDKQDEKQHYLCNAADESELQIQAKVISNSGNFESDSGLVDVKVCDICGDAGREQLLATCSKCSDGAEHTYCMRVMLNKVPEGEWLCEECQLWETEDKNPSSPQTTCGQRAEDMNTLNHKKLHAIMVTDTEMRQSTLELQSPRKPCEKREGSISYTTSRKVCESRPAPSEMIEGLQSPKKTGEKRVGSILSQINKRASESGTAPLEMASPRKYGVLSRESLFKNSTIGNMKSPGNASSSSGQEQAIKGSRNLSRSYSFGGMSKIQVQLTSPQGLLKQCSFNSSNMKSSAQQLTDIVPGKNMMARHPASRNDRHDGAVRKLIKSASFKSMNSCHSNVSFVKQKKSPQSEELKPLKAIKKKSMLENKNSLTVELPSNSPSPKVDTSTKKAVSKAAQFDENLFSKSASSPLTTNRGSVCSEKKPNFPPFISHERCSFKDQKPCGIVPRNNGCVTANESNVPSSELDVLSQNRLPRLVESVRKESEANGPVNASNSWQATCDGKKIELSQKSNQEGYALQSCLVSKAHVSTKPSDSRSSKESCDKMKIRKNPVGAATPRSQINGMLNKCDLSAEIISQDLVPRQDDREKLLLKEIPEDKDVLRSSYGDSCKLEATMGVQHDKRPRDFNLNTPLTSSDELGAEPMTQNFHGLSSVLGTSLRSLAIPEHEFIWQGSFEVSRAGNLLELFNGIQAHLSTSVSSKVPEVAAQFSCRIQLEEVPRLNLWPLQFQEKTPSEDNIALFFFAKDIESYERTYRKLLENMLKNDLALKGVFSSVELLIFPSDKLTENCQRWNNLLFLWGVFRARKSECSRELPDAPRELCGPTLSTNSNSEGLYFPRVFSPEETNVHTNTEKELSSSDGSPKSKAHKSFIFLDSKSFLPSTSTGCVQKADELPSESPRQAATKTRHSMLSSCFLPVTQPSESMYWLHSSLDGPSSELQTSLEELPPLLNSRANGLNNENQTEDCCAPISQFYPHKICTLDRPSAMPAGPNLGEGNIGRPHVDELAEKARAIKFEAPFYCGSEGQPKVEDCLCLDSRPRKRLLHSSNSTDETVALNIMTNFVPLGDESECKKRKYCNEDLDSCSISRLSSTININQQHNSDDDETPRPSAPDLELALGKKSSKEAKVLPFLSPSVNRRTMQDQADLSASFSLSTGFPGTVMDSDLKTKRFLPEGPDIKTWSLFGGFTG